MKLERKPYSNKEYFSDLTKELDDLAKFKENSLFKHYILADDYCIKENCLAIRVPGGTVGGIWFNQDNVITKIQIDTNYVVKTYPENVEEIIQKYVGATIDFFS